MTLIIIDTAKLEDAAGIVHVQRTTWLATYPNTKVGISKEDIEKKLNKHTEKEAVESIKRYIESPPKDSLRLVAKEGDLVVGHCFVMKRQPYNKLQVLYVLPASQGKSVGYQLASRALEWLGTERDIALEVVQYNETAIRFYKRLGFEITKEVHDPIADLPSGASMPEYQMVKKATT